MKIKFHRTYAEFSENYLATHYSGGINSFGRLLGGPLIMVLSAVIFAGLNSRIENAFARGLLLLLTVAAVVYGFLKSIAPLFNLFLVWLRRETVFSAQQSEVEMELKGETLFIYEGQENFELALADILTIQHRTQSTWLLTKNDVLISIPRDGILAGHQDAFIEAIEAVVYKDEEEES